MQTVYPVVNRQLGSRLGEMSDDDIASLEEYADLVLNDLFYAMSADSQMAFQDKKDACWALLDQARADRETTTYLEANTCLDEARAQFATVAANEQAAVEEKTDTLPVPQPEEARPSLPEKPKEEEGVGTLGWVLIGSAGLLVLVGIASAATP